ncbi:PEP-CTERM sorting domain-containing protein [Roseibacillus persicicus]|uniref:PEP-CTERM protein-sorting domain-containing protein n=1 Tax=Roseibacillus persicicus TaxID=454148 RepID=A0A918WDL1_9BACT|nr:PEP-CTERM sorting domain-containing protein [Roseibacillus persicicus]GHC41366.1 hypothetical protein GCM10007100_02620 [Roseibacillus persicicus]
MPPVQFLFKVAVCWTALGGGSVLAQSSQIIVWGSELKFGNVLTSSGGGVTLAEFSIELGSFGSFAPTPENTTEWMSHWKVFDAITVEDDPSNDAFITGEGNSALYGGRADLSEERTSDSEDANPSDTFVAGEQAYVFVRNADVPGAGTEWLLYTSRAHPDWNFPGGFAEELQWYLPDADEAVWGAINGTTIGGGSYTDDTEEFYFRTHTFQTVPEPASGGLFAVAGLILARRSRR